MPRFRLTLAYDGTDFAGSQAQPHQRTVQGELDRALGRLLGHRVSTLFAGRTDRGVHATGQVVAFDAANWRWSSSDLQRALNAALPSDVRVLEVGEVEGTFHPRYDATWREYRYWIAPGVVSPFLGRLSWIPRARTECELMDAGAQYLLGNHDFASFVGGGEGVPWSERAIRPRGTTRTVLRCACREILVSAGPGAVDERVIEFVMAADGFLPRMVRNIVGSLVEVGQRRQVPGWIGEILGYRDRRLGSVLAPAHGLTLSAVGYGDNSMEEVLPAMPEQGEPDKGVV